MPIRIAMDQDQVGRRFAVGMKRNRDSVLAALRKTANDAAREIEEKGRQNMASAGRFGQRWMDAWHARVSEGGGFIRIGLIHDIFYWTVFQFGKVIHGKPLLWIPLSFASDAQGVMARDYPGKLFRVERAGRAPLLLTTGGEPKYFGKESVTIPKKFRLLEIAAEVSRDMGKIYKRNFKPR
jgi:hypothetical protein